ncbi:MAG: hypothetical protein CVV42_07415 [Candidatus Riflebacteria bacterium HGW-Riflebacteria-2]|jgi:uncharacterized RDD family membrane protein YckC|nr:MAG: hypothetical protein CVV42_07415 [Candidatus Riflebacteria bacterium HGW-Riflebacteria-2]
MVSERFNVELQGVTPDLMQANGSYDAVPFKNLSAQRIAEIMQIISQLCPPDGDDVCPVNLIVHGSRGDHTFSVFDGSGQLYCADPEGAVNIEQAIMMITGQKPDFAIAGPAPVTVPASPAICPSCQTKIEPDESFCGNCGQAVVRHAPPPPPSPQAQAQPHPARRSIGKAPVDRQTYDAIVGLMGNPLPLSEYRAKFPYLQKGPKGPEYREVIDAMFRTDPPPELHTRLTMPPRDWGIKKPGKFRRSLTAIVDFPAILAIIVAGAAVGAKLPLDEDGLLIGILALSWIFLIAPIGYYTFFETTLGATPGGLIMGLRVVDGYGNKPSPSVSIVRILAKVVWIFMLIMTLVTLRHQVNRLPSYMVKLPSGESLQPIDDGEVVIN